MVDTMIISASDMQMLQYVLYGLLTVTIFSLGLLFYGLVRTPMIEFLKCDFLHRTMLARFTSSRRLQLRAVKEKNGAVEIDGGIHTLDPSAMIPVGGKRGAVCFESFGPVLAPEFIQESYGIIREGVENIKVAEGCIDDMKIKAMLQNLKVHHVPISESVLRDQGFDEQVIKIWRTMHSKDKQDRDRMIMDSNHSEEIKLELKKINDLDTPFNPEYLKSLGYNLKVIRIAQSMDRLDANNSKTYNVLVNVYSVLRMLKYNASPTKWKVLNEREKADTLAQAAGLHKGFNVQTLVTIFIAMLMFTLAVYIFNALVLHGNVSGVTAPAQAAASIMGNASGGMKI